MQPGAATPKPARICDWAEARRCGYRLRAGTAMLVAVVPIEGTSIALAAAATCRSRSC